MMELIKKASPTYLIIYLGPSSVGWQLFSWSCECVRPFFRSINSKLTRTLDHNTTAQRAFHFLETIRRIPAA